MIISFSWGFLLFSEIHLLECFGVVEELKPIKLLGAAVLLSFFWNALLERDRSCAPNLLQSIFNRPTKAIAYNALFFSQLKEGYERFHILYLDLSSWYAFDQI